MISVVCVYNNERSLKEILLRSLKNQTSKYELILVDNINGQFKSAAEALNYGGKQANGKYIMFVHQDVELDSDLWLENAERILDSIPKLGVAGVAGMSEEGKDNRERERGCVSDCGEIWHWANPVQKPEEVQTLDECLLIVPKSVFSKLQFDGKTFDGWHCYGVDYCLSAKQMELQPYVIPAFIYHRSLRLNVQNLFTYQKKLYNKHRRNYKHIYTTTGEVARLKLNLYLLIKEAVRKLNFSRNFLIFYEQNFPKSVKKRCFRTASKILSPLYERLFPAWIVYLKKELDGCDTVLDLACGYNSPIQHCDVPFSVGIELFEPYLQESRKKAIHNGYIKADVRSLALKPNCFDAVIALEILEHLTKDEGHALIRKMETWARKKVIITTPNGYLWQNGYDNNPLQEHKSGWSVEELQRLGFKVSGMNGWKKLRGYKGEVKYTPAFVWERVSDLSQKITYHYPKLAFQLFATKQIDDGK
jgi:GT2 family glycosyltransferase